MIKPSDIPARKPEPSKSVFFEELPKKAYVRPDHLTNRPFRDNPALAKLRTQNARKNQPNFKIRKK